MFFNSFYGFKYFRDKFHLYIGLILPVLGFTITTVIGTNLALSLGMIGALSIIRFRTPVRSSYELVIYFILLTVGVAAHVDLIIAILLTLSCLSVILILQKTYFSNEKSNALDAKTLLAELSFEKEIPLEFYDDEKISSIQIVTKDGKKLIRLNIKIENSNHVKEFINKWKSNLISHEFYH
ncbi:DUF4956 domain-containing protein [Pelagibacteraceae bacterium]|nr:DUF4956 domain-containing protein [Pelagibacteraceae bacterium]